LMEQISRLPIYPGSSSARGHAVLSVYGSAMLWAVSHSTNWPAPIALFLFGLGLGYMAYRTQSLLPSMITHSLFNTLATLVLVFSRTG
jgi:membrane protease YdiL (CAAX protease family)